MNGALTDLAKELGAEALFDEGVEAARNACVAGASIAAAAITAAAWYDNPLTGAPAVLACMARIRPLPFDVSEWVRALAPGRHPETGDPDFTPGFGFVQEPAAAAVRAALARLATTRGGRPGRAKSAFFLEHGSAIAAAAGSLNQAGLAALLFLDDGVPDAEAERMFLLWRMDTAIAEAQRARSAGLSSFPFFGDRFTYEGTRPPERTLDLMALRRELGLV
jgi:hypothetical protein